MNKEKVQQLVQEYFDDAFQSHFEEALWFGFEDIFNEYFQEAFEAAYSEKLFAQKQPQIKTEV